MSTMPDMHNHDHANTLLDDYVMGTLSADDLVWMDRHVATCDICQEELPLLLEATFALAMSADDPDVEMSADLWTRIEGGLDLPEVLASEPAASVAVDAPADTPVVAPRIPSTTPRATDLPKLSRPAGNLSSYRSHRWLAAAAAVLILIGVGALIGREVWWGDQNEPAQEIALHDADGNLIGRDVANLEYLPDEQRFVLHMDEMPEAPEGQVYQAWLIAGDVPTPVGIVDPATGEFSVDGERTTYDAFAITVEPAPYGSELPTTNPIVVAPLDASG